MKKVCEKSDKNPGQILVKCHSQFSQTESDLPYRACTGMADG